MAVGWNLISKYTVTTGVVSFGFTSIPNTYNTYMVYVSARSQQGISGNAPQSLRTRVIDSPNFSYYRAWSNGTDGSSTLSNSSGSNLNQTEIWNSMPQNAVTANTFSNTYLQYQANSFGSGGMADGLSINNSTSTGANGFWFTSIQNGVSGDSLFFYDASTIGFLNGSTFYLYGLSLT